MSESANGAPMNYARVWLCEERGWVRDCYIVHGGQVIVDATANVFAAKIFIDPSTLLVALRKETATQLHPASFAEWIEQRE